MSAPNLKLIDNITEYLKKFDIVFPIIHGSMGEDGRIQSMLEMLAIPYVGECSSTNYICYDKELTKIICNNYSISQLPYRVLRKGEKVPSITYPVIIKPARAGSSIGISIAHNKKELKKSIDNAFMYDDKIIIEKYINCRELEVGVLITNKPHITEVGEVVSSNKFYDYEAKYEKESNIYIPASIEVDNKKKIMELAYKIIKVLEIKSYARIDFLLDTDTNTIYFNEINTIPGFTDTSMYPMLWNYNKLMYSDLLNQLLKKT